jgi:K(+)-stimulated pyrophosphate-energized sodium pump
MGLLVVGFGLSGLLIVWLMFENSQLLIGYAFGSSLVALFLRVGGGIYTKSADVGADLVGKVEKGIPEDDPRNPAVIADAVGDNVGDIAGMGSDLFESYVSAIVAAAVLGVPLFGEKGLFLPILLAAAGILSSLIGNFFVVVKEKKGDSFQNQTKSVRKAMEKGIIVANILMVIASWFIVKEFGEIGMFWALLTGLLVGILIGEVTKYYTSDGYKPVLGIAKASQSGTSINIIEGLSQGMISTVVPALAIGIAMIVAFEFANLFGIALAGVGILAVLGINLSSDSYGPIVDNAAGIAEMTSLPPEVRQRTDALDSVGNTTAATGKGFAIGSAALTALAWIATFFETAKIESADITDPRVIGGFMTGAALSFLFCALLMKAVSKGSFSIVEEVRRQFAEIKGLMEGKAKPDYSRVVDLTTKRALKEMILPGVLVVITPILTGILLGMEGLGGLLMGGLVCGFLLAVMMSNSGGAWDNAKKYIESGNFGGKGSEAHKAAVVGDTVGDPMKDTAGPSLNILIKLIGKVAVIFVPLFVLFA